jgi:hypothetical protein
VERYHQTLKKWLARQPPADSLADLQAQLDTFTSYYNTTRPHRALGRRTPADAYHARPKAIPAGLAPATSYRILHGHVAPNGTIIVSHYGKHRHIGVGRRHAGTPVLALIAQANVRIINQHTGELLRALTLDPARDYQPLPKTRNDVSGHL